MGWKWLNIFAIVLLHITTTQEKLTISTRLGEESCQYSQAFYRCAWFGCFETDFYLLYIRFLNTIMNLNNPIRFRRTITSYPIPHNNNGDRNRKPSEIDAKIDSFLTSTFSNGHGGEERKRTNLQIINSFYSTTKDNSHQ